MGRCSAGQDVGEHAGKDSYGATQMTNHACSRHNPLIFIRGIRLRNRETIAKKLCRKLCNAIQKAHSVSQRFKKTMNPEIV